MNHHWDLQFMEQARMLATWSKDPSTKCGAVIVDDFKAVIGQGFNGFARGLDDSPELYADQEAKLEHVIHSEENAIILSTGSLRGGTMYVMGMPCTRCAARIIQAGISTVVVPECREDPFFWRGPTYDYAGKFAKSAYFFDQAGVEFRFMFPTHYDARLLMGVQHPYWQGRAEDYFDDHDHYCR
jgi:dCMP deaminase